MLPGIFPAPGAASAAKNTENRGLFPGFFMPLFSEALSALLSRFNHPGLTTLGAPENGSGGTLGGSQLKLYVLTAAGHTEDLPFSPIFYHFRLEESGYRKSV